ncbi:MAG: dTMP kinase [Methanophagales archaeon]|nr:dTMP kinase [Methanophagales archaeon]
MTSEPGVLIVLEGTDGAGLSTQTALLTSYIKDKGEAVISTKEPTSSHIGNLIRSALKHEWKPSPRALQLLFAADRAHHLENEIEPALRANKIVISDRYILSSLAFGSIDVDQEFLKQINSKFQKPDLTFIIDTPPRICLERINRTRENIELFEERDRLEQVRENYLSLRSYFKNTFIVDGDREKEKVSKDIQEVLRKHL